MSVALLSRIQFATVALFHFLFVPLTLGLSVLVAFMESRYARTGQEVYLRMTRYWSRLLLVNFAVGVVTGITLEFQFGMNWAEYSRYVGDVFGAPLAIEATVAFFLESTFIGLWAFSWKRVSRGVHAAFMWVVAGASTLSALWILLANGWMQRPRGHVIVDGRALLQDFGALIGTPYAWIKFFHVVVAAWTLGSFFVMGISAINLLRGRSPDLFKRSFRIGATLGMASSVLVIVAGDLSGLQVSKYQPAKLAAIEAQWDTMAGAPFHIVQLPRLQGEGNLIEAVSIPKALSLLAYHDPNAVVQGLRDIPPDERPPVLVSFLSFRLMVALGFLFLLLALLAVIFSWRDTLTTKRWFLGIMAVSLVLPYLASELGWVVAEIGRQPWIVYGLLRTQDAVSRSLTATDVLASLIGFVVIYGVLAAVDVYLLARYARKIEGSRPEGAPELEGSRPEGAPEEG
jgi:cytochrome d ubiquinol oxidase subunit I